MIEYFAYGSNMNLSHLADWLGMFGISYDQVAHPRHALLHDYRFRTNYITSGRLGAANIESHTGKVVEGLLLKISPSVREALRIKEGWPQRYEEVDVLASIPGRKRRLRAMTYVVTANHRLNHDVPVSTRYRNLILSGAKSIPLSRTYQRHLGRQLVTFDQLLPSVGR